MKTKAVLTLTIEYDGPDATDKNNSFTFEVHGEPFCWKWILFSASKIESRFLALHDSN